MTHPDGPAHPFSPTGPADPTTPTERATADGTQALLRDATHRLVRAVDGMDDAAYGEPSGLPGWTRGHVVAHLALNAEALAGVLRAVTEGAEPGEIAMYADDVQRDADIDALAAAGATALRTRLYGAVSDLAQALDDLPADRADVVVERTPGSERTFRAGDVVTMRLGELEIHGVDLDLGYTPADWPAAFAVSLVDRLAARAPATLVASDTGHTWQAGDADAPTITGTVADLGWWLTGRGDGTTLTSDGDLPRIESW
ncbi:maleylpyruvate isomerase family mycothiol-dependent enzyme [Nocardioides sp. C4-1]|uniref:maleylpyruvate isomerase family mycothiol-dependent enzyme n=1 Tax=Nocardioides sp. C4-1 TaxID=3151851 RepID=UPI0032664CF7